MELWFGLPFFFKIVRGSPVTHIRLGSSFPFNGVGDSRDTHPIWLPSFSNALIAYNNRLTSTTLFGEGGMPNRCILRGSLASFRAIGLPTFLKWVGNPRETHSIMFLSSINGVWEPHDTHLTWLPSIFTSLIASNKRLGSSTPFREGEEPNQMSVTGLTHLI